MVRMKTDRKGELMKYCPKCGSELLDEAVICPKCGCAQPSSNNYSGIRADGSGISMGGSANMNTDFTGLSPYYQEKFTQILQSNETYTGGWNWCSFFFGVLWALSKGLWLSALVMFALSMISGGVLTLIIWFIYGFRGNYMYYSKYVKNQQRII